MNSPPATPVPIFPAVLIAGTPHCGKSVLAYLLSQHLRRMQIAHYLLRAAPDGEGDWFLKGDPAWVRPLRQAHKGAFIAAFVAHMQTAVENRLLPLLVDAGGLPRDEQFGIVRACTHAILLYKDERGARFWDEILQEMDVPLLARLRSVLDEPGAIDASTPYLQGRISGLDRENPRADLAFGALLERVAGLFYYEAAYLERVHLRQATYPPISERALMQKIDPRRGEMTSPLWHPEDLPAALAQIVPGKAAALYGRGPVWLAAAVAAHVSPAPFTIYDARYGWLPLPEIVFRTTDLNLNLRLSARDDFDVAEIAIPSIVLEPERLACPSLQGESGLVLSGKLPRWAFATLAWHLRHQRPWLAVYEPAERRAVVVFSHQSTPAVGDCLPIA